MHYRLTLSFDANNLSAPLVVNVTGEVGGPPEELNPPNGGGSGAVTYSLQRGDWLTPRLRTGAAAANDIQIKVTSLALVATCPGKKPPKRLSPFDQFDACTSVSDWGIPERINNRDIETVTTIDALQPIVVTARKGNWSITGYLSILLDQPDEDGGREPRPHLFTFQFGLTADAS